MKVSKYFKEGGDEKRIKNAEKLISKQVGVKHTPELWVTFSRLISG